MIAEINWSFYLCNVPKFTSLIYGCSEHQTWQLAIFILGKPWKIMSQKMMFRMGWLFRVGSCSWWNHPSCNSCFLPTAKCSSMTMTALMTCIVFCRWTLSSCFVEQSVLTVTQNLVGLLRLAERLGTDLEPDWEICWGLDLRQAETVWSWDSYWKWPFIVDFPIKNGDFPLLC